MHPLLLDQTKVSLHTASLTSPGFTQTSTMFCAGTWTCACQSFACGSLPAAFVRLIACDPGQVAVPTDTDYVGSTVPTVIALYACFGSSPLKPYIQSPGHAIHLQGSSQTGALVRALLAYLILPLVHLQLPFLFCMPTAGAGHYTKRRGSRWIQCASQPFPEDFHQACLPGCGPVAFAAFVQGVQSQPRCFTQGLCFNRQVRCNCLALLYCCDLDICFQSLQKPL
jgi:hypothetical protein